MGSGSKRTVRIDSGAANGRAGAGEPRRGERAPPKAEPSTRELQLSRCSKAVSDDDLEPPGNEFHAGLVCIPVLAMWTSGALFLSQMPSDSAALEIASTWSPMIHVALTTATVVHAMLQLINLAANNAPRIKKLVLIPLVIDILPMLFSIMYQHGLSPVYLDVQGRVFQPIRYLTWICTTSMLIYLQWLTSESRVMRDLLSTLAWDITMLLSGVWASFASSETLFYFAAGVACYAGYIVLEQQRTIYLESIKVFHHLPHTARALRNVYLFSTLSWCLFPIVWFMGKNDWISHNDEEALWCAADFLAKMCQSIALHQGVLSTVEDRNQQAMEASRDSMLHQIMMMKDREQAGTMHIANVSHELRTPLNGIIGLSEALITDPDLRADEAETIQCLKAIRDSGARLNMMVNNMLDNAELTQQELKLELGPVKLADCLREVTLLLAPMVSSKTTLKMDVPDSLPPMRGNRDRLVQVFFNLIGNSVKFCRDGTINIVAYTRKRDMIVEVRDTGPGLSPEQMEKLFTPFAHGGAPKDTKLGSTGLGLCLVEALVQTHGGTVKAVSEPNVLTVFTTTIPLYSPKPRRPSQDRKSLECSTSEDSAEPRAGRQEIIIRAPDMATNTGGLRRRGQVEILSVDDDPMNHMVLRNVLKQTGYKIIEADCGEQALKFLTERYMQGKLDALPSLILMDVMMPGLNGFQTTEKIREMFPQALLPIIMISATASDDSICRGFRAGCNDYISKPIKKKDLLMRIKQKLGVTHKVKQHLLVQQYEEEYGDDGTAVDTPEEEPPERTVDMTVVAMAVTNVSALADTTTPEQLHKALAALFKKLHAIRQSCRFCTLCMLGDLCVLGIGHQAGGMPAAEQAEAALTLSTLAMHAADAVSRESGVALTLGTTVHAGPLLAVCLPSGGFVHVGRLPVAALAARRYPGCICVGGEVATHAAGWALAEMPPARTGAPALWVVQDGAHWVAAQQQAAAEAAAGGDAPPAGAPGAAASDTGFAPLRVTAEEDLAPFLASIGMREYTELLGANRVTVGSLAGTEEAELQRLGVAALAHRQRLIAAAKYGCLIWGAGGNGGT
eukprot:jgi/Tetstr1/439665/TSEL_028084.t1